MNKRNIKFYEWWNQIRNKYRFQVVEEETYKVKFVFILTKLNVFGLISSLFLCFFIFIFCLIAYTPIKQYVPGFAGVETSKEVVKLKKKTEDLKDDVDQKQKYIDNLLSIAKGGKGLPNKKGDKNKVLRSDSIDISSNTKNVMKLREQVDNRDKYTVTESSDIVKGNNEIELSYFFKPLSGLISNRYNSLGRHFGVDIVATEGSFVKAAQEGTIVFSGFVISTGYTVIIQHENDLTTVYKHNKEILKGVGSVVKAGDVIALVGNTGEETSGPHLHFEIWLKGKPVNPLEYINFD